MAVEENESKDHETWSNVARSCYNKEVDEDSKIGRLHHQQANPSSSKWLPASPAPS